MGHQVWAALGTLSTESLSVCLLRDPRIPTIQCSPPLIDSDSSSYHLSLLCPNLS